MNILGTTRIALHSLKRNRTRTFLTMLGVIIGVAAVISMLAVGQGASDQVQAQIASMGTNVMMIFSNAGFRGGARGEAGTGQTLTEEDAQAIKNQISKVKAVSMVTRTGGQVIYGSQNWRTSIQGVYPDYFDIRDLQLDEGIGFTENDIRGATKVCVVGKTVVDNLMPGENAINKIIRIRDIPVKVIGVLAAKGQNAMGMDQDDVIIAPFSTVEKRLTGHWHPLSIQVSAATQKDIPEVKDEITQILRARHKTADGAEDDFTINSQTDIAETANQTNRTMTILLASIAGISLLVGGIGIMNIMLVSVTERTKEIGIRLAIGAKKKDILMQFLVESVLISFMGGFLGICLGYGVTQIISKTQNWPVHINIWAIILAFAFSAAVGIFFGWYPAKKAANLKIINALRYE